MTPNAGWVGGKKKKPCAPVVQVHVSRPVGWHARGRVLRRSPLLLECHRVRPRPGRAGRHELWDGANGRGDTWCRSCSQSVLSDWLQLPPGCCVLLTSGPTPLELGPTRLRSLLRAFIQEPRFVRPNTKCGHFVYRRRSVNPDRPVDPDFAI